ncbi:MAG: NAD(P)H-dependent oxidoreductase [Calothrix sp. SM1_5_4]|nr:NAD(P)H-dependent oxidoreductase [Calothrix sp. SM1_5_4]
MTTTLISASHRPGSCSLQVANWIAGALGRMNIETDILDLAQIDLPFWSEEFWNEGSRELAQWMPFSERLQNSDALVIISPEWAGMVPPKLINFLLMCSRQELAYKPALLVGVSAGPSGTYPHRAVTHEQQARTIKWYFLPDHLIVRHVGAFLNPKPEQISGSRLNPDHPLNRRLELGLRILQTLAQDLKTSAAANKPESVSIWTLRSE